MSEEYKSPLNSHGIRCFNSAGMGMKLSSLLHISSAVVLPPNTRQVVRYGQTGMREDLSYPSSLVEQFDLAFANVVRVGGPPDRVARPTVKYVR
ncbi:hypothetical protein N7490_012282 [Penicillium lividum]|nr:hypothetical protein N7490_012282 [Penicillium lividum]